MTDTTDQQAVTVAQIDVDAAMELCAQWDTMSIDHVAQFLARNRLASVSSASAEKDVLDLGTAWHETVFTEPVPATNQAGEVERLREIMARLPAAPWRVTRSLLDGFGASLEVDNGNNFGNIGHIRDYDTACALADLVREVAGSRSMAAGNIITEEWLADVLQDSLEMDWTSTDGARAIMAALAQVKAS